MRTKIIIGIVLIILGFGVLFVFSRETPGFIAAAVLIVLGLVLTFMNRQNQI